MPPLGPEERSALHRDVERLVCWSGSIEEAIELASIFDRWSRRLGGIDLDLEWIRFRAHAPLFAARLNALASPNALAARRRLLRAAR